MDAELALELVELRAWKEEHQQFLISASVQLLNAGFKGDGVLDGIKWLVSEQEAACKAVFMPKGYPGSLADFLTKEVWPSPRSEDIEKIQVLKGEVDNLSMLARRLMRHIPDGLNVSVKEQAAHYLKNHGLEGSILR